MPDCRNCDEKQACVPFYLHENCMMHYNRANKRMLIALIVAVVSMAIGLITLGGMFLTAYNAREEGWQNIVHVRLTEVQDAKEASPPGV